MSERLQRCRQERKAREELCRREEDAGKVEHQGILDKNVIDEENAAKEHVDRGDEDSKPPALPLFPSKETASPPQSHDKGLVSKPPSLPLLPAKQRRRRAVHHLKRIYLLSLKTCCWVQCLIKHHRGRRRDSVEEANQEAWTEIIWFNGHSHLWHAVSQPLFFVRACAWSGKIAAGSGQMWLGLNGQTARFG